jgi:CBS domain-containing protein
MTDTRVKKEGAYTQPRATAETIAENASGTAQLGAATEQGGSEALRMASAAAQTAQRSGEAVAERMRHVSETAVGATRREAQLFGAMQQQFTQRMAEQLEQMGHEVAQATQLAAENVRRLLVSPNVACENLQDLQKGMTGVFEGLMQTNLEAAQQLMGLADVAGLVRFQNRAMHSYLDAFIQSSTTVTRSIRGMADRSLGAVEQQLEHSRRGRPQGPAQAGQNRCVGDVMKRDARITSPEASVQQVAQLMRENDTGMLPVGEGDRLVGVVTDRDVALRLVADGRDPARTKVREVMTSEIRYVFEDEDLGAVAENMAEQQLRRLPVLNRNKRLVGIVSLSDLARQGRQPGIAGEALSQIARTGGLHNQHATAEHSG